MPNPADFLFSAVVTITSPEDPDLTTVATIDDSPADVVVAFLQDATTAGKLYMRVMSGGHSGDA
jgi:hypothetical protein